VVKKNFSVAWYSERVAHFFITIHLMPAVASPSSAAATTTSSAPLLRMVGVRKSFGPTIALAGVDLEVNRGEVLALVGENGAGKSTLMKVLSGAHQPDEGEMFLAGQPFRPRRPLDARRAGVAMIYQELSLARDLSVMENILLGVEPMLGPVVNWTKVKAIARDAMAQVGHPKIPLNEPVGNLSIATQQLIEIARAVAVGARVLVLDEPTSSLTLADIQNLFTLVRRLKAQGLGIVYISHFLEEVKAITDRFTVLRDGKSVGGGRTADAHANQIIAMMVGRNVDDLYPRSQRKKGEAILDIQNLAGVKKPVSASLSLHRGEVLGIAGLVGAGRTEFLRALFGLDAVRNGSVRISANSPGLASPLAESSSSSPSARSTPGQRWSQGMGMVSEDRKTEGLAITLSIADNLTLSKLGPIVFPSRQARDCQPWIEKFPIKCRTPHQPVGDLSGGNQQKIAIARLLHHDVDVLLLDEPTRGIDVGSKAQIYQIIDELACSGKAILMVSSYLPELMGVCDRIAVMCRGVLGQPRPVNQWTEHAIMLEATGTKEGAA
jgi:ribose transport system ATP-binding protein